jgi:DNA-binding winged helix-turn-helix (wHTH) protein
MRFADCLLDLTARQLERQGKIVPLEPKMYELLEVLIKRRPAVVSNNDLDELLWPEVYVARTSLTRLVSKLRSALGDTPHGSNVIRTAYKTGYAFCAEVTCLPSAAVPSAAAVQSAAAVPCATIELVWKRRSLPLTDGVHLAGRDDACGLQIDTSTVSRQHARITVVSGAVMIEDLGSTNGTHVNGTRISIPTRVGFGDQLSLGSEVLQVRRRGASALTVKVDEYKKAGGKKRAP